MEPVIVRCFEDEPKGFLLFFGYRKGESVAFVRMEISRDIVCVNPEALRFLDVITQVA